MVCSRYRIYYGTAARSCTREARRKKTRGFVSNMEIELRKRQGIDIMQIILELGKRIKVINFNNCTITYNKNNDKTNLKALN